MLFPKPLHSGDTIAIVSPSGKVNSEYIEQAIPLFKQWRLHVRIGKHAFDQEGRFAGSVSSRKDDLQEAIDSPDIKAIYCSRGGYGAIQLVDRLNLTPLIEHPKWLIGYSDITVLHALWLKNGVMSLHAPMLKHLTEHGNDPSALFIKEILFGQLPSYTLPTHSLNCNGIATGPLVGGNLSTLYSLRGTPYDIIPKGAILFIEDIGERAYHIDRMMENLRLGHILQNISGLIVGQFTDCPEDPQLCHTIYEGIHRLVRDLNIPVCFNFPTGHVQNNYPLICGATATLSVSTVKTDFQQHY